MTRQADLEAAAIREHGDPDAFGRVVSPRAARAIAEVESAAAAHLEARPEHPAVTRDRELWESFVEQDRWLLQYLRFDVSDGDGWRTSRPLAWCDAFEAGLVACTDSPQAGASPRNPTEGGTVTITITPKGARLVRRAIDGGWIDAWVDR